MKPLAAAVSLCLLASQAAQAQESMTITRNGWQRSTPASDRYFTGPVRVDPLFQAKSPSRYSASYLTFEPGARSSWHSHPLGRTIVVIAGTGWVQQEGRGRQEIRPGDVIWTPPGVKYWHGATTMNATTHLVITESLNGKDVEWMERVTEAQYNN